MAFFRKWKTHYRHKKFKSDDAIDAEDWGLGKKVKNSTNSDDIKLDLGRIETDDAELGIELDEDDDNKMLFASYDLKYLGCTPIETKRSEKITSEAIKTVIANAKAGGRKNKTQKRVKLNVSQDGIEVLDHQTQDSLMHFSIYKISYCSVDASHDHAFSFVSSETDPATDQENMSCHVFYCAKRKIAHEITLMVARCFEHAYQQWRDTVVAQHAKTQSMNVKNLAAGAGFGDNKVLKEQNVNERNVNSLGMIESKVEVHKSAPQNADDCKSSSDLLLIDLAATDTDVRKFLQNTWVSFDDDVLDGFPIKAC